MKTWKIREIKKADMPAGLQKIKDCPERLYYRGDWDSRLFAKSLAIVGSRRMSRYGRGVVDRFMPELVSNGVTVISGFMYGVDCQAHRTCVEMGGKTVAVLGWGLKVDNGDGELGKKILETGGLIISEYEADFKATLWSFPQRNRIVSGLSSLGVLVVEAGEKSGSLITAKIGKQQGRQIWAVPGAINSDLSAGTNWLIKNGLAKMATEAGDVLGKQRDKLQKNLFEDNVDSQEKLILANLDTGGQTVDELAKELELTPREILAKISTLCLKNLIEEENGRVYKK